MILPLLLLELHRAHRRERVIDVVHRIEVDVQLVIPVPAPVKEIIRLIRAPRHIFLLELFPLQRPLLRRQAGIGITDVLELVDRHAKRHKCECLLQMGKAELVRLIPEKALCIRIGKLLHRHGMDLRDIR